MTEKNILNNRYLLDETLGSGGMAEVYRARDMTLERTVVIKVLRKDYSSNADFRQRFHQEAKAAANLTHPNIVTIHDFGLDAENRLFIVMEYVPGTDLKNSDSQPRAFHFRWRYLTHGASLRWCWLCSSCRFGAL